MNSISQLPIRGQQLQVAAPITGADAIIVFQNGVAVEATVGDLPLPASFVLTQSIVDAIFAWGDNVGPSPEIVLSATGGNNPTLVILNNEVTMECVGSYVSVSTLGIDISSSGGPITFNEVPVISGGATGTFTSADGKTVTVTSGIITSIV